MSHMSSSSTSRASTASFNMADVMFSTMMIPHHAQAVAMAKLAATRATSSKVKALADRIQAAQQPEIDLMSGWLKAWGHPVPSATDAAGMSGMGHDTGTMNDDDMSQLEAATGRAFDRLFLTQMIEHHRGALTMAKTERSTGKHPEALALAGRIITTQTDEIASMEKMLKR
jgi:uncharacterized protein (DUF305 family)